MTHLEQNVCRRNTKVSCAPRAVIGLSLSISRIQEFLKYSDGISFLYGWLWVAWWRMGMLHDLLSFITTLIGADLWSKGRVNLMPVVELHGLSKMFTFNYFASSHLIAPIMFLQEIEKLWEGMLLNVEIERKYGTRVHLMLLMSQAQMVVLEDL